MKSKGLLKLVATLIVIGLVAFVAIFGIGSDKKGSASNVKLGLDLAGGVSITYETVEENPSSSALSDTVYKMQKRAESFSTEAQVYPEGSNRITVSIPDVTDADEVLASLGSAGNIYFIYGMSDKGIQNISTSFNSETGEYETKLLIPMEEIIANGDVVFDGSDIADVHTNVYQDNIRGTEYAVVLTLNDAGRQKFANATAYSYSYYYSSDAEDSYKNIIAIVYDNEVVSAPHVASVISDGNAVISGFSTSDEAFTLASNIRIGSLPLELYLSDYYVMDYRDR